MTLKGKEALIIDDDPTLRMILRRVLENNGLQVGEARNIQEAYALLKERVPHFIFLDIHMPGEDGLSFLEKRRSMGALRDVPVMVVSGEKGGDIIYRALSLGAKDYLVKPLDSERLIQKLRKHAQDRKFLSCVMDVAARSWVMVGMKAELFGISETEFQISAAMKVAASAQLEISGRLKNVVDLAKVKLVSGSSPSQFSGLGTYLTHARLQAPPETVASIRKLVRNWPEIKSSHPKDTARRSYPTVLAVDDDPTFNRLLSSLLGKIGVKSEIFRTSEEFLSRLKKGGVDACLIDLNISSARTGFLLVEAIRNKLGPYLPLYLISGDGEQSVIAQAIELGADGYIVKSPDLDLMSRRLADALLPKAGDDPEEPCFQTPREFSSIRLSVPMRVAGADELGMRFVGQHLPAKGAAVTIEKIQVNERITFDRPLSLTVTQTWVDEDGGFGFYAENDQLTPEYSELVRSLVAQM